MPFLTLFAYPGPTVTGAVLGSSMIMLAAAAMAEDYKPGPVERVPAQPIVCNWSKLSSTEYRKCQDRKEYYENLTPEQKQAQEINAIKAQGGRVGNAVTADTNRMGRRLRARR